MRAGECPLDRGYETTHHSLSSGKTWHIPWSVAIAIQTFHWSRLPRRLTAGSNDPRSKMAWSAHKVAHLDVRHFHKATGSGIVVAWTVKDPFRAPCLDVTPGDGNGRAIGGHWGFSNQTWITTQCIGEASA